MAPNRDFTNWKYTSGEENRNTCEIRRLRAATIAMSPAILQLFNSMLLRDPDRNYGIINNRGWNTTTTTKYLRVLYATTLERCDFLCTGGDDLQWFIQFYRNIHPCQKRMMWLTWMAAKQVQRFLDRAQYEKRLVY